MIGSSIRGNLLLVVGVPVTVAGFVFVLYLTFGRASARDRSVGLVAGALSVMAGVGVVSGSLPGPMWFDVVRRIYLACGLVAIGIVVDPGVESRRRTAVWWMIAAGIALHLAAPFVIRDPQIDVWTLTQTVVLGALHGVHPYRVPAPDFFKGAFDFGYSSSVYPYMPATLIAFAPAVALFGDYRLVLAICFALTIVLLRAACRAASADRRFSDLVTLAVLLHPRGLSFTVLGWTEPLLVVVACAFVYLALRSRDDTGSAIAWMLLPAMKQYVLAPPLLYVLMAKPRPRVRAVAIGVAVALATVVPFAIWAARPTFDGIVFQFRELRAPRLDSTSIVAVLGVAFGITLARWWSVVAQIVVAAAAYVRLGRGGLDALLLASAASLYATFLFGWQAFQNYYYFIAVLLVLAAVASSGSRRLPCGEQSAGPS